MRFISVILSHTRFKELMRYILVYHKKILKIKCSGKIADCTKTIATFCATCHAELMSKHSYVIRNTKKKGGSIFYGGKNLASGVRADPSVF